MFGALWSLLLLSLARELFTALINPETPDYWTRLGYGVTAVKTKQVCITKGYWNLELHLKLPFDRRNSSRAPARDCEAICDRMGLAQRFKRPTEDDADVDQENGAPNGYFTS